MRRAETVEEKREDGELDRVHVEWELRQKRQKTEIAKEAADNAESMAEYERARKKRTGEETARWRYRGEGKREVPPLCGGDAAAGEPTGYDEGGEGTSDNSGIPMLSRVHRSGGGDGKDDAEERGGQNDRREAEGAEDEKD